MAFPTNIEAALKTYDKDKSEKGGLERLFGHPAIRALRKLRGEDQKDLLKLFQCFVTHYPGIEDRLGNTAPVFQVFLSILREIDPKHGEDLDRHEDLERNKNVAANLQRLNRAGLLTPDRFAAMTAHSKPFLNSGLVRNMLFNLDNVGRLQDNVDAVIAHSDPETLANALKLPGQQDSNSHSEQENLFTQENIAAVLAHPNLAAANKALVTLYDLGRHYSCYYDAPKQKSYWTQKNFDAVIKHANPKAVDSAILHLRLCSNIDLIRETIIADVIGHPDPRTLAEALKLLKNQGSDPKQETLFTEENIAAVTAHNNLAAVKEALEILGSSDYRYYGSPKQNNLWTQTIFDAVIKHAKPEAAASAIKHLNNNQLLEYVSVATGHQDPEAVASSIVRLNNKKLLTEKHIAAVTRHHNPEAVASSIEYITDWKYRADIREIMDNNFHSITRHRNPDTVVKAIQYLFHNNSLRDETIAAVTGHSDPEAVARVIVKLDGAHLFTRAVVDEVASSPETFKELSTEYKWHSEREIRIMIGNLAAHKLPIVAREEAMRYLSELANPETTEGLRTFTTLMEQVKTDGINVIWDQVKGPIADRMFDTFGCLYSGRTDSDFTDLMDKGKSVASGALVRFQEQISSASKIRELASHELHIVARNEAMRYLSRFANPETTDDLAAFTTLMGQIKEDDIVVIWDQIKESIADRMFDTFGCLYGDRENPEFTDLMNNGQSVPLEDLCRFQAQIERSEGYHQYLQKVGLFSPSQNAADWQRLYDHRHDNGGYAQHAFDKRFGLTKITEEPLQNILPKTTK